MRSCMCVWKQQEESIFTPRREKECDLLLQTFILYKVFPASDTVKTSLFIDTNVKPAKDIDLIKF